MALAAAGKTMVPGKAMLSCLFSRLFIYLGGDLKMYVHFEEYHFDDFGLLCYRFLF